ncbi:MAG: hypothetical protein K2X87_09935, partial [Gemmataceae bacterium]|nr:hypothetical protein [Gemmataceae bacterium]
PVPHDPADPLRAALRGDIEVRVNEARVRVSELRLVRRAAGAGWSVHPADVEAAAKAAGYETAAPADPPGPPAGGPKWDRSIVWAVAAAVLAGAATAVATRRGRR